MLPVPPSQGLEPIRKRGKVPPFYEFGWYAGNDGIGRHIFRDDGVGTNNGPVADCNSLHHNRTMANPNIMADLDRSGTTPSKKFHFIEFPGPIAVSYTHLTLP